MKKKVYLTKEGLKRLRREYKRLENAKKQKIEDGSPRLLESEELNPEFASFRDEMEMFEERLSNLEYALNNYEIIAAPPKQQRGRVGIGAKVRVEKEGQEDEFLIVSTFEANPGAGKISDESPVGRALLGRKVGDVVCINSPIKIRYKIKSISYEV